MADAKSPLDGADEHPAALSDTTRGATTSPLNRRTFIGAVGVVGASALAGACATARTPQADPTLAGPAPAPEPPPGPPPLPKSSAGIARRRLGRTQVMVSAIGLGGWHLGLPSEDEAIGLIHQAIDHGMDFMDNCWSYNGGRSEERMGKALQGAYRQRAFLMTKVDGRTRDAAQKQLEQSLKRLRTDVIDLVQVHEVIRMEEPGQVFASGGALEALEAARKAGKVRFIGFTGHKDPSIHLAMLAQAEQRGYVFDTVQMPLNVMDAHYHSFERQVLPVLQAKDIGVIGMKPLGAGKILESGAASAEECLRYAMSLPTSTVITGCDTQERLEQALRVAGGFSPLGDDERRTLLARTAPFAAEGQYERFKISSDYDGTTRHPRWLTTADI